MRVDGKRLRMARAEMDLSLTDLEDLSGVTRRTIRSIEKGEKDTYRATTIMKIAETLNKPLEYFEEVEKVRASSPCPERTSQVLQDILEERMRQNELHGDQNLSPGQWLAVIGEEFGEICQALQENEAWAKDSDASDLYQSLILTSLRLVEWAETFSKQDSQTYKEIIQCSAVIAKWAEKVREDSV
ncbi:MAG: helix-turn-helix transcriptional regulator [Bacillus sp. (in: firmicutes)]